MVVQNDIKGMTEREREGERVCRGNGVSSLPSTRSCNGLTVRFCLIAAHRKRLALELQGQSDVLAAQEERVRVMDGTNPRFILRNYIAQNAIEAAESGDFSEVRLSRRFRTPWRRFPHPLFAPQGRLYCVKDQG